jgi:hypothetical protein
MPKNKPAKPKQVQIPIKWSDDVADHDYAAAHAYLSLKLGPAATDKAVAHLREAQLTSRRATTSCAHPASTRRPWTTPASSKTWSRRSSASRSARSWW